MSYILSGLSLKAHQRSTHSTVTDNLSVVLHRWITQCGLGVQHSVCSAFRPPSTKKESMYWLRGTLVRAQPAASTMIRTLHEGNEKQHVSVGRMTELLIFGMI